MKDLSILIDLSPITVSTNQRSGLARYSYDLGKELSKRIDLGVNASGSVWSTKEVMQVAAHEKWTYVGKTPPDYLQNALLQKIYNLIRTTVSEETSRQYELYHSTYARIRRDVRKHFKDRHLLTVHDLTPLLFSRDYFHPHQKAITSRIINSIKPGDHVIAVSENTRQDLINYRNLDPSTVYTVHNGYDPNRFHPFTDKEGQKIFSSYQLGAMPYFLTLSALGPHKNLKTFLDAGYQLDQQFAKEPFRLVIGGKPNTWLEELLKSYPASFLDRRVLITGFIPDEHLAAWYSGCRGFVFPSLYEGFGLPLVEAMACGAPVIYANNSSLKEIGQGIGFPCETSSEKEYAAAMSKLLDDESLQDRERTKSLDRAKAFTQDKWIAKTINVYQQILKHD